MPIENNIDEVNLGYFHGGRTSILYRAYLYKEFKKENLNVVFISKNLHSNTWHNFSHENLSGISARATGLELVDLLLSKKVELATIGETAFIKKCSDGVPIVAIAELGFDHPKTSGHGIALSKKIKDNKKIQLENIVWGTRRSSGGDDIFLKEFLLSKNINLEKVKIISNISDDQIEKKFVSGEITGAYLHLRNLRSLEKKGIVKLYSKLNWVNPELSHALLVTTKENLLKRQNVYMKFLNAYKRQIQSENSLPVSKKIKDNKKILYGKVDPFEIKANYKGMDLPNYREIPSVRIHLEKESQELLFKHKEIKTKINLERCIDNSLLQKNK